ncbi:MAG: sigma-70 family RNA polymerase sigma factor [Anaerolineales bacterium]|nr:sigma-70 family RNA polymerase sigma factor [Anaerolineales bacterium]
MPAAPALASDSELLERIRRRNQSAFAELYDRYSSALFNYLLRLTHDQQASEDLLQEVFLGCWRGARHFRGQASVKTWLFRIAHHQSVSWLRKHRQDSQAMALESITADNTESSWPENLVIERWENAQLLEALDVLSDKHRAVVELTFGQHFSYGEIAEIMDCPVGTVKSRMSYALRQLEGELRRRSVTSSKDQF